MRVKEASSPMDLVYKHSLARSHAKWAAKREEVGEEEEELSFGRP